MALKLLARIANLSDMDTPMLKPTPEPQREPAQPSLRRRTVIDTARQLGLLEGANSRIGGRIRRDPAAKTKSGIASDTELLEYASRRWRWRTTSGRNSCVERDGSRKT